MKVQKQTLNQRSASKTTMKKEIPNVPISAKPTKEKNMANLYEKSYA